MKAQVAVPGAPHSVPFCWLLQYTGNTLAVFFQSVAELSPYRRDDGRM